MPALLAAALLAACETAPEQPAPALTAPPAQPAPPPAPPPAPAPAAPAVAAPPAAAAAELVRFEALEAFPADAAASAWLAAWPAWVASCRALTAPSQAHRLAWQAICADALARQPRDGAQARAFFAAHTDAYRVMAGDGAGGSDRDTGLVTGYFEPEIEARRQRSAEFAAPIYHLPADAPTQPRAQLEASGRLRGAELFWLRDPVEAFFLEVQGSGRLLVAGEGWVRVAYAGSNGQPYRSIGRWLVEQGELPADRVSMASISEWAHAHRARLRELLDQNPRVIFFREERVAAGEAGPVGSLGVPLTAGVSVAVDPRYLPLGAPLLLATPGAAAPAALTLAQDTGGAILGPLRIDRYWGAGAAAGEVAGREREAQTVRVLVPRGVTPQSLLP